LFAFNVSRMLDPAQSVPWWASATVMSAFVAMALGLGFGRATEALGQSYEVLADVLVVASRRFPRESIVSGVVVPAGTSLTTELSLRNGDVLVFVHPREEHAEGLLRELGLASDQRRATLTACEPRISSLWSAATMFALSFVAMTWTASLTPFAKNLHILAIALVALVVGAALRPVDVTVGRDGVQIRSRFRPRFIPYENILGVDQNERGQVELQLEAGDRITIGSAINRGFTGGAGARHRALRRRIEQARARAGRLPPSAAHSLARQGRSLDEWRARLRQLISADADYRGPRLDREQAALALSDPNTAVEVRIGAALALAESGLDDETSARIRIAANTSANARLRVALEQIAECEGEAEAQAIDEACSSDAGARRRPTHSAS
jgi:hypothetical protein